MQDLLNRAIFLLLLCAPAGCAREIQSDRESSPNAVTEIRVVVIDYGGAMGFNRTELQVGVADKWEETGVSFRYLSDYYIIWESDYSAKFCYEGEIEPNGVDGNWRGSVLGKIFNLAISDECDQDREEVVALEGLPS